ncbi:MAG: RE-BsaWI domain-containing protein [Clostridium sp.]|jgi:type II restriction enzyme
MGYIEENQKVIRKLNSYEYFQPTIGIYNQRLSAMIRNGLTEEEATRQILDYLKDILRDSQQMVEDIIQRKIASEDIKDASQARKSVAGSNFQRLVAYGIIRNILVGNITKEIIVNVGYRNHPLLDKYASISVGSSEDTQKPDSDVLIYKDDTTSPIVNFSCKTSLRERAGQTYKWKLLVDLATCTCPYILESENCPKNIYNLQYDNSRRVIMNFVTADLYNEVNQPQINGMFNFFDNAYITKPNNEFNNNSIICFSNIINNLNEIYD